MKRLKFIFIPIILMLMFGCGANLSNVYKSPTKMFFVTLKSHDRMMKAYNDYYDIASVEEQAQLRKSVKPLLIECDDVMQALNYARIMGDNAPQDLEDYLELKNKVIELLLEYKIVEVE